MNIDLKRHPETDLLIARLRDVPLGQEISYADLSRVIGRDVRTFARPRLSSARDIALREFGVCFFAVRGQGLRRITVEDLPQIGVHARRSIQSKAKNGLKAISAVVGVSNGACAEVMRNVSAERAQLGLLHEAASETNRPAFDPGDKPTPMPPAIAAQAFLKHIGAIPSESPHD
jgi:hypothetical protein